MLRDLYQMLFDQFGADIIDHAPDAYRQEPRGRYVAPQTALARPRSVDETANVVQFCSAHDIGIIPYAGGTGLVGGQLKIEGDAIILSVERMNELRSIHVDENLVVVEAGMILQDLQAAADSVNRLFPLALASQGSCRIGGNLATNAGGVQVLRYGNTRDLCLGIEAVLPDGTIHHGLRRLRKDNTGYDLRNLLIGSEGTLGIITAAVMKLFPKPKQTVTAFVTVLSPKDAVALLSMMQDHTGGLVSAFELINHVGLSFLRETLPDQRIPFDDLPEWSVLIEVGTGAGVDLNAQMLVAFENAIDAGLITDAILAQSVEQQDTFWAVRELIPEANRRIGAISSHDISIPISLIPKFIAETPAILADICEMRINCFGHVGDGNLHYNFYPVAGKSKEDYADLRPILKRVLHDQVHAYGGSVSAEHGIGRLKVDDLERYSDPAKLTAMRAIKDALDPKGIMNPGAILRAKK